MTDGDSRWPAARPLFWGFMTIVLLFGCLGSWTVFTTVAGAIIAPGQIEVSHNRQVVQHPDGGVIAEIMVTDGARVRKGDILLHLDGSALNSELVIVVNQLLELGARRARLEAQRDGADAIKFPDALLKAAGAAPDVAEMLAGQANLFARQAESLKQAIDQQHERINQIDKQIEGFAAQEAAIKTQTDLLEADLAVQRDLLSQGLTQSQRVSETSRQIADLEGDGGELTSARAEAEGRITEINIQITSLITGHREKAETELRDVVARQLELMERQHALVDRISRLDIRAPSSGIILGLKVTTPQSVIRPADPLMYIVPQDRPLLVAARVPVSHVDEVRLGQNVRLVFSSLPGRTTPELTGHVTLVSADALIDERSGAAYFRAEIAINDDAMQKLHDVTIVPGMPVEAFIRTGDRTPLSYLLKPFTDYFRTAFRET